MDAGCATQPAVYKYSLNHENGFTAYTLHDDSSYKNHLEQLVHY